MQRDRGRERTRRVAALLGAGVVIGIIIWIDVSTGVWQDLVIVAGLAAGLVTFLLTVLVLDRVLARSAARRWAPVNRLALSEFLHAIADEERSEVSRGVVVPRSISPVDPGCSGEGVHAELDRIREQLVAERRTLSDTLSRWTGFLASSGDNEVVLLHVAEIALTLDRVRDATLEVETHQHDALRRAELEAGIASCNAAFSRLAAELGDRLALNRAVAASRV